MPNITMNEYQCFWKDYTEITLLTNDEELEQIREFEKKWPEQPNGSFSCRVCGEHFESQSYLYRTHYRVHMGVYPYKCQLCGFASHQRSSSLLHFRDDHYKRNNWNKRECTGDRSLCQSTSDENFTASDWKDHVQHNAISVEDEIHQILLLGIKIPAPKQKPAIRYIGPSYTCNLCNTTVNKEVTLIAHYRTHTGYKPYECKLCHQSGANREWMRNHFRTNHVKGGGKTSTEPALVGSDRWQLLIIDNDQRFDNDDVLHMSSVFANVTDEPSTSLFCVICKTRHVSIRGHYLDAHCDRHISCRVCHVTLRNKLTMKTHVECQHRNLLDIVVNGSFEESDIPALIKEQSKRKPYTFKNRTKRKPYTYKKCTERKPYTYKNRTKGRVFYSKLLAAEGLAAKAVRKALKGQRKVPRLGNVFTAESRLNALLAAQHVAETSVARAIPIEELVEYKPEPDQSIREVSRPELRPVEVCLPVWSKTPITPEYNRISFIGIDRWQVVGRKTAAKRAHVDRAHENRANVHVHFINDKTNGHKLPLPQPAGSFSYQPPAEMEDLFGPPEVKEVTRKLVPFGRPLLKSPMKKGQNTVPLHGEPAVHEQPASLRMGVTGCSAPKPVRPQSLDDVMNGLGGQMELEPATTSFQLPNLQQLFPNGISLPSSAGPPAFILVVAPEPKHT